ncbi:MAG: hypothetical protein ACO3NI_16140, partial [bacterium]
FENPFIVIHDKQFFRWFHLSIHGQKSFGAASTRAEATGERQRPVHCHLPSNTEKGPDQTTLLHPPIPIYALLSETRQLKTLSNNRFSNFRFKGRHHSLGSKNFD